MSDPKPKMYVDKDGEWWVRRGKIIRHVSTFRAADDGGPVFGVQYRFTPVVVARFDLKRVRPGDLAKKIRREWALRLDEDGDVVFLHRPSGLSAWALPWDGDGGSEHMNWYRRDVTTKPGKPVKLFTLHRDGVGREYVQRTYDGKVSLLRVNEPMQWGETL